eukprot:CAMPEP_0194369430 /NCGR_PEP_ID=MMETSP0174-20130528/17732_1 /TAXON_ID=216777 /ORGANISM="Proboscia alata, Strain PI-D3" /LENGTH=499 /DNA_ID=CAMNT_0039146363 /DNA_START=348 /DNA_END=1847 /DNA_ORIENTATION=+
MSASKPSITQLRSIAAGGGNNDDVTQDAPSPQPMTKHMRQISVLTLLTASFLNLLGFTMAGPITPTLGQHFGLATASAKFGSLTSAYPLGMLLGVFLWPRLSDTVGRKPVLVLSLLGSGLGLLAQSLVIKGGNEILGGGGLGLFLAMRVLTGCFAGSSPVSKAYLADVGAAAAADISNDASSEEKEEKKNILPRLLALRDASSTLAFILGPALSGVVYEARRRILGVTAEGSKAIASTTTDSLAFVIGITAVASLAASALIALGMKEISQDPRKAVPSDTSSVAKVDDDVIMCPLGRDMWTGVASVCLVSFLYNVGDSTFHAFFSALLRDSLQLDARAIGLSFTSLACLSFATSTSLSIVLLKKLGVVRTCVLGLSCIGTGLVTLAGVSAGGVLSSKFLVFAAATVYYFGVPLYGPTIPTMLLRCVPPNKRGAVMGLDGAINTIGRVLAPLAMGELYRRFGSGMAFGVAGGAVFGAAGIAAIRRILVVRDEKKFLAGNL